MFMTITIRYYYMIMTLKHASVAARITLALTKRRDQIVAGWDLQSPRRCISSDSLTNLYIYLNSNQSETRYLDKPRAHR